MKTNSMNCTTQIMMAFSIVILGITCILGSLTQIELKKRVQFLEKEHNTTAGWTAWLKQHENEINALKKP